MTSMAFVLGVLPLAIATGAGSASQRSIGTGVMGGMVSAVLLSVLFVPVFYVVVRRWFKGSERQRKLHAHELDGAAAEAQVVSTRRTDGAHCARAAGRAAGRLRVDGAALRAPGRAGGRDLPRARRPRARRRPQPASEIDWQQFFVDPRLKRLIELALQNNRDLRIAVLNIERVRAQYQIQRSEQLPTVLLGATGLASPTATAAATAATTPRG